MGSTLTTFDALLKERYLDDNIVEPLVYGEHPFIGMLQQTGDTEMIGDQMPVPVITANPQGVSSVFSNAQDNSTNVTAYKWVITAGDYHGVVDIGDKAIMASRTNKGAFVANKRAEIDGLYETAGDSMSAYAWGNGGNALGQIASLSGDTFTLKETADAANFEIGMEVVVSGNDGATSTDSLRTGNTTIDAVNRSTGVIEWTASDLTSEAADDYVFRLGDFYGDEGSIVLVGVQAFIAATDAPDSLWGVTAAQRATDPSRLAGVRVAAAQTLGKSIEDRIKILMAHITGRHKAKSPTAGFLHPEDFVTLDTVLSGRGVRPLEDKNTKFGYMKIEVMTPSGALPIYTDRHCPKGTFFALRLQDWGLSSMGEFIHPQNGDGLEMLRVYNSTDYEFRLISYPLLWCRSPKNNGRVSLT